MKTEAELLEIKARADAATPGPWIVSCTGRTGGIEPKASGTPQIIPPTPYGIVRPKVADWKFVASSRTDIPALVESHLEALREIERLTERLSGI